MTEAKNTVAFDGEEVDSEVVAEAIQSSGTTDVVVAIQGLNNPGNRFYSSIKSENFADKLKIAAALTTSIPIDENLNKEIKLVNFIVQPVDLVNEKTNEINTAPRVVMIDADGTAYHATSIGLLSSLENIVSVLGEPSSWPAPVSIQVVKQKGNKGFSFFTIKFL